MEEFLNIQRDEGFGVEVVVWLIIAFIWVVAQLVARAKQKSQEPAGQTESAPADPWKTSQRTEKPETGGTIDRQLREFLEGIGGEIMEEETAEDDFLAPPRETRRRTAPERETRTAPERQIRAERAPAKTDSSEWGKNRRTAEKAFKSGPREQEVRQPSFRTTPPPPMPPPPPSPITHPGRKDKGYKEVQDIDHSKQSTAPSYALINPKMLMVDLRSQRMPIQKIPIKMLESTSVAASKPPLKSRHDLRRAILGHVILCPPLAVGEDKSTYTRRQV